MVILTRPFKGVPCSTYRRHDEVVKTMIMIQRGSRVWSRLRYCSLKWFECLMRWEDCLNCSDREAHPEAVHDPDFIHVGQWPCWTLLISKSEISKAFRIVYKSTNPDNLHPKGQCLMPIWIYKVPLLSRFAPVVLSAVGGMEGNASGVKHPSRCEWLMAGVSHVCQGPSAPIGASTAVCTLSNKLRVLYVCCLPRTGNSSILFCDMAYLCPPCD